MISVHIIQTIKECLLQGTSQLMNWLTDLELQPPINNYVEEPDMPTVCNFLIADTFCSILFQEPPTASDRSIALAYPLKLGFQKREEIVNIKQKFTFHGRSTFSCYHVGGYE